MTDTTRVMVTVIQSNEKSVKKLYSILHDWKILGLIGHNSQ